MQTKTRNKVIEAQHDGKECVGNSEIVQSCNLDPCEDGKGEKYMVFHLRVNCN